jgi:1,4-dihydroxy-2-naphthoate octaprenyltransferase
VDTVARRLGFARSKHFFALLIVAGYAAVPLLAALGLVPWGGAAALLSLSMGIRLIRYVGAAAEGAEIMDIPLRSAKLHMVFSLLYAGGILLQEMLLQRPLVHAALLQGSLP